MQIDVTQTLGSGLKRQPVWSSKEGDYHRLLLKGAYDVSVTVDGKTLTVPVRVNDRRSAATILNFVVDDDRINYEQVYVEQAPHSEGSNESGDMTTPIIYVCVSLILVSIIGLLLFYFGYKKHGARAMPTTTA